jgi:hypothetical protein
MKIEIETFKNPEGYALNQLKREEISCFNGEVNVEKYHITSVKIEESKEVYQKRLQELWEECSNHHHWNPLRSKAKQLGVELLGHAGEKRKEKI